jgi:hypothetical protein
MSKPTSPRLRGASLRSPPLAGEGGRTWDFGLIFDFCIVVLSFAFLGFRLFLFYHIHCFFVKNVVKLFPRIRESTRIEANKQLIISVD